MTTVYDLYAVGGASLEEARRVVEAALNLCLLAHESGFHGGEYFRSGQASGEHFILKRNWDPFDEEWAEPSHQSASYLLYVNKTTRSAELRERLEEDEGVVHLRRKVFD